MLEPREGDLRGAVDSREQIQFAFFDSDFGDVDAKEADRICFELPLPRLVALDVREPADPMPLQTAMQRLACQMRDRRLQGMEAIIEGSSVCLRNATMIASSSMVSTVEHSVLGPSGHQPSSPDASTWRPSSG